MFGFTRNTLTLLAVAALVGCQAQAAGQISLTPKVTDKGKTDAKKPAEPALRAVELFVFAPASMVAAGGGNIVGEDASGLAASNGLSLVAAGAGNIVAAGAGNIVAAGGGNIIAAGAGNLLARTPSFRVQAAAVDSFKAVEQAVVTFKTLSPEGTLISKVAATTDAKGYLKFAAVQDSTVMAVAKFKLNGKVYELAAPVAKGAQSAATMVDPINTFIAGRIRAILRDNGIKDDAPLVLEDLKMVWDHFNKAGITMSPDDLKENASLADLDAFYKAKVPLLPAEGQAAVKAYMSKIAAAAPAK